MTYPKFEPFLTFCIFAIRNFKKFWTKVAGNGGKQPSKRPRESDGNSAKAAVAEKNKDKKEKKAKKSKETETDGHEKPNKKSKKAK